MNLAFLKIFLAYKTMAACFLKKSFYIDLSMNENKIFCIVCVSVVLYQIEKKINMVTQNIFQNILMNSTHIPIIINGEF